MKTNFIKTTIMMSVILLSLTSFAHAEDGMEMDHSKMDHSMHQMMMGKSPTDAPKSIYDDAMNKMHKDMMVKPTGDADIDFVKGMIPHHQGAIDMAKVVLAKGKDPAIRKLAGGIVKAQESEIKMMRAWLKAHNAQ